MSKINMKMCATSNAIRCWEDIDFDLARRCVKKLQKRIALANGIDAIDKVASLQHKLIHSFYAKALAIHVVTTNKGKDTPGVDNILWLTSEDKWNAIDELKHRGYKPKPLRRIYIKKSNGKKRPLSIPTMKDRAMQTLYKFALEPIAESTADLHSYGFRKGLSTRAAIIRCQEILDGDTYPWVLEADIEACFDNMNHEWIMDNIPMRKDVLYKFLKSGYIENGTLYPTEKGIPQGGCISTVICNMVLDGLEVELNNAFHSTIQFVRYADDFIVAGTNVHQLKQLVMPLIDKFLSERGLKLSKRKTKITYISDGFDFLGWNVKKDDNHLTITPPRRSIDSLLAKIENVICCNTNGISVPYKRIKLIIRGWINYHKGIVPSWSLYDVGLELYSHIEQMTNDAQLLSLISSFFGVEKACSIRAHRTWLFALPQNKSNQKGDDCYER